MIADARQKKREAQECVACGKNCYPLAKCQLMDSIKTLCDMSNVRSTIAKVGCPGCFSRKVPKNKGDHVCPATFTRAKPDGSGNVKVDATAFRCKKG